MIFSTFPKISKAESNKQDKIIGVPGQVVGFDENGNAVAQDAPDTGVTAFNGRTGEVQPMEGDYTAEQVGASPADHTHNYTGLKMSGNTVQPTLDSTVTAKTGAEIFNDYRERTYSDNGFITAGNVASGNYSHAEGCSTTASGSYSHAEGSETTASEYCSHAEGRSTTASGNEAHAEGCSTTASGSYSHAEDFYTTASGKYSHAEGSFTTASGESAHAEGSNSKAQGMDSHAEGSFTTASGNYSHAEGRSTTASGNEAHAEGYFSFAVGRGSHAEGESVVATDLACHCEGRQNIICAPEQVFNVESYNASAKSFVLESKLSTNETSFALLSKGVKMMIMNTYYTNDSKRFTINSVDTTTRTIIVDEDVPTEKFTPGTAVVLSNGGNKSNAAHAEGARVIACNNNSHAEGLVTVASGSNSHSEGYLTTASNSNSHAEGWSTTASGEDSHAEGEKTYAIGRAAHAEGAFAVAAMKMCSHAEGGSCIAATDEQILKVSTYSAANKKLTFDTTFASYTSAFDHIQVGSKLFVVNNYYIADARTFTVSAIDATNNSVIVKDTIPASNFTPTYVINLSYTPSTGYCSHAEGDRTVTFGNYGAHAEGRQTISSGESSHAEGRTTTASGKWSHAEGAYNIASGAGAHAEGSYNSNNNVGCKASGIGAHAEGVCTTASGAAAHAEGVFAQDKAGNVASGDGSHAEGCSTSATATAAHSEGADSIASGNYSHAGGRGTIAEYYAESAIGKYNVKKNNSDKNTVGDLLVVGKGTEDTARANVFRVTTSAVYGTGSYNTTGADYAELFQWEDGNPDAEDRIGRFVTLDGEKIRYAESEDDFILGIISGNPSVVGDVHDDQWNGMYLYDIYGRPIWEDVKIHDEVTETTNSADEFTGISITNQIGRQQKVNPDYDHTQKYIPRSERAEWAAVGMMGKLVVDDDGTCKVNGYCTVGDNGIAIYSDVKTRYRVISRLDDTHIRVLVL